VIPSALTSGAFSAVIPFIDVKSKMARTYLIMFLDLLRQDGDTEAPVIAKQRGSLQLRGHGKASDGLRWLLWPPTTLVQFLVILRYGGGVPGSPERIKL
jgi:hypothetical protein